VGKACSRGLRPKPPLALMRVHNQSSQQPLFHVCFILHIYNCTIVALRHGMPIVAVCKEGFHMATIILVGAGAYFVFSGVLLIALLRSAIIA